LSEGSKAHPIRCWEWLDCRRSECKAYHCDDLRCWLIPHASCFDGSVGILTRLAEDCNSCPVYTANRERAAGKRRSDGAMLDTLDAVLAESIERASVLERVRAESKGMSAQVTLLAEVGRAIHRTMKVDEILLVILTAATAGDGLGFNRAFLLLADESGRTVRGRMAVGPSHPDEADLIWKAMDRESKSLGEILSALSVRESTRTSGIMRLEFPISGEENLIAVSLKEGASYLVSDGRATAGTREIVSVLGSDRFVVVPLVAEDKKLGAIIADNFITGRPIRHEDVRLLEIFASQAALAILNAALHNRLEERVKELEHAHGELHRNHLQILRAERLLTAGGLAATLIHDLKAPVVSIGLMAKAAASGMVPGTVKETLENIGREIVRIEEYLRSFAKSAGKGVGQPEAVDVAGLVRDSLDALKGIVSRCRVETTLDLNHGGARVRGSRVEFRQVMVNLLQNSLEAMPDGGSIAITTGIDGGMVRISIRDSGGGIPEDLRASVFSPFFTTKPEGSGLGLVIAKRTVTNYGGRMALESKEGVGTCFSIYLPVARQAGEEGLL
jgi:signal transduction histidine kinase